MIRSMSVQPRPQAQRPFDLAEIDTPEEALLMPGADLWTGLVLGPLSGRVSILAEGEALYYDIHPAEHGITYTGWMNGEAFELQGTAANPRGIRVEGSTPGGEVDSLRRGGRGGFGLDGQVGEVEFSHILALDQSGGSSGNLAYLGGTVGGVKLEARARKGEDNTVEVEGTLGELELRQSIRLGPDEQWIISGTVGDHQYLQIIERF